MSRTSTLTTFMLVSVIQLVAFPQVGPAQTATAEERIRIPSDVANSFLGRIRELCQRDTSLKGVRVADCWLTKGQLIITGQVNESEQLKALEQEVSAIVIAMPKLRDLVADGVSLKNLAVIPIRSQNLPQLQMAFATQRFQDENLEAMLRQTRLDDAFFDKGGGLVIRGVCLNDDAREIMQKEPAPADLPTHRLIIEIEDLLEQQLTPAVYRKLRLADNRVEIEFPINPVADLQKSMLKRTELDGVLIRNASFNELGLLNFEGLVVSDEQREQLQDFLTQHLAESTIWRSPAEAPTTVSKLEKFSLTAWKAGVQQQLAESDEDRWHRTLVKRAWFSSDGEVELAVGTVGVEAEQDAYRTELQTAIRGFSAKLAADTPAIGQHVRTIEVAGVEMWKSPVTQLQDAIAERESLDGVRVIDAKIDAAGKLAYIGTLNDVEQSMELMSSLTQALKTTQSPLADVPATVEGMQVLPISELLKEMREWTSKNLEEVWLERLYFDSQGRCILVGWSVSPADQELCRVEAQRLIEHHPIAKAEPKSGELAAVAAIRTVQPGLTEKLRSQVIKSAGLRGLSIHRGYYDVEGQFHVSGVQERSDQSLLLNKLFEELRMQPEWKKRLPSGLKVDSFDIVPLAQILACLNDVMPAYSVFDGITLTEAFHDEKNQLVFHGTTMGKSVAPAEKSLRTLLAADPVWGIRVAAGVSLKELESVPAGTQGSTVRDRVTAVVPLIRDGKHAEARGTLSRLILQAPDNSLAWYLRAICHLGEGHVPLASRDLYRVSEIEKVSGGALSDRTRSLENLQGALRAKAEMELKEVSGAVAGGRSVNSLFGVQNWKAQQAERK